MTTRCNALVLSIIVYAAVTMTGIAQDNDYDVIWLASEPTGATVTINGEERGTTPLFVGGLEAGNYAVAVNHPGYLSEQLQVAIPTEDASQRLVKLQQRDGTCIVTSDPPHASIAHGTQLLGRTPLVLSMLPPGSHDLRVLKHGYDEQQIAAVIDPNRATRASATLTPNTGSLTVSTIPADAKVLIDGHDMGNGSPLNTVTNKSAPRSFDGLAARKHKVEIQYQGITGPAQVATITTGTKQEMLLMLWYPNIIVKTKDGRVVKGMIIQESDTDLVIAKTLTDHVRIKLGDVADKSAMPAVEARRLAKEAIPK